MFDWQKQTEIFDAVDKLIADEQKKYEPGSFERTTFDRLKAVVEMERSLVAKMQTVTPENAQALFSEIAAVHSRFLQALSVCANLMQEAGAEYNRDLLRKIQEYTLPQT